MSLFGLMRTGVSGMNAQASRLSAVADNIANADTSGYKRSSAEFSTLVMPDTGGSYNSGGVNSTIRKDVSTPGILQYTTSVTDLAVDGNGFFVVQDAGGTPYLTRAGSFVPDGQGNLVNAAGYQLMAYSYANGVPSATVNGFEGLEPVTIADQTISATPSTEGTFTGNLPSNADVVTTLPSTNDPTATYTNKSSMVAYDNLGNKVLLDVYFSKTGSNTWEATVFDQSKATPGTSFPYTGGALGTANLTFDGTTGKLTGTSDVTFTVPNGASFDLNLSNVSQLGTGYSVSDAQVNGNAPNTIDKVQIGNDGTIYAQFSDGTNKALYKIPLADVTSPDQLTALAGNVYSQSPDSGSVQIGFANEGKLGSVVSGALEDSNVDIATELTDMIAAQRSYTANSKVFQTGSDLMDILVNLKR